MTGRWQRIGNILRNDYKSRDGLYIKSQEPPGTFLYMRFIFGDWKAKQFLQNLFKLIANQLTRAYISVEDVQEKKFMRNIFLIYDFVRIMQHSLQCHPTSRQGIKLNCFTFTNVQIYKYTSNFQTIYNNYILK